MLVFGLGVEEKMLEACAESIASKLGQHGRGKVLSAVVGVDCNEFEHASVAAARRDQIAFVIHQHSALGTSFCIELCTRNQLAPLRKLFAG